MIILVNKEKDIASIDTHNLLKNAKKYLMQYQQLELSFKKGELSYSYYKEMQTRIYENSPYTDIWDFTLDYARFNIGLPVYIDIKLVWKGGN